MGAEYNLKKPRALLPYIFSTSSNVVPVNENNFELNVVGFAFDAFTQFVFDTNNISIVSKTFIDPSNYTLIINIGSVEEFFNIAASNSGSLSNNLQMESKVLTILIPNANGLNWQNVTGNILTGTGEIQTSNTSTGWNKQGTFGFIPANTDGTLKFVFEGAGTNGSSTSIGMMGFGVDPTANTSYNTIDHAIYISSTTLYVYENGAFRGNFGNLSVGDVFEIKRIANVVTYFRNGSLFYTSTVSSTGALHFDCSLFRNIRLSNLQLVY